MAAWACRVARAATTTLPPAAAAAMAGRAVSRRAPAALTPATGARQGRTLVTTAARRSPRKAPEPSVPSPSTAAEPSPPHPPPPSHAAHPHAHPSAHPSAHPPAATPSTGHAHAHVAHGHAPAPWHRRLAASVARPFVHFSSRYMHYLHTYPVATKSVTSGFMYCLGDLLAQVVAPPDAGRTERARVDVNRAAIFFVYGLFVAGPIYHLWFSRLDRLPLLMMKSRRFQQMVRFRRLQRSARALGVALPPGAKPKKAAELSKFTKVTSKVLADQIIFSPLYLLVFFYTTGVMRGQTLPECTTHVREVFWPSFLADCAVWPAVQVINFAFVPVPLQPIYVNVLNVFWNAFLSFMAHKTH